MHVREVISNLNKKISLRNENLMCMMYAYMRIRDIILNYCQLVAEAL